MINIVHELSNRQVLAKNDRIIIFGEDMAVLGTWGQILNPRDYVYSNERWWSKADTNPKDLIDNSILSGSNGTWHLDYCTTCDEWGHDSCDFEETWEPWEPTSPDYYDPFDDDYTYD